MSIAYRVLLHDQGPALWPDYIGLADLEGARQESGTPIFNTMYQADPGGLKGQIIRREFFRYMGDGAIERDFLANSLCYMTVDPAISEKTSADETAVCVGNIAPDATVYLRWFWHGRVGVIDQERVIDQAYRHYRPVTIGIESVAYQAALIQMLAERRPDLPLEAITHGKQDKFSRFLALGALYEFGKVVHHPSLQSSAYEHQAVNLPAGKHDDMADAAAMLCAYAGTGAGMTDRPAGFR